MPRNQVAATAATAPSAPSKKRTVLPRSRTKVSPAGTPPTDRKYSIPLDRRPTLPRRAHSPRHGHKFDILKSVLAKKAKNLKSIFKGNRRIAFEDITNNPKPSSEERQNIEAEAMKKDSKSTDKSPLISQEYANEKVNFLMEKMKAYLYYPKNEDDFIRHIERYEEKYQKLLKDMAEEIETIIVDEELDKDDKDGKLGGGKEMHGGALSPNELERLALLAIEYKRTIFLDDIIELNKKTIGLTLIRTKQNEKGPEETEHNILVQIPIECFIETNKKGEKKVNIQRIINMIGLIYYKVKSLSKNIMYHLYQNM